MSILQGEVQIRNDIKNYELIRNYTDAKKLKQKKNDAILFKVNVQKLVFLTKLNSQPKLVNAN